MKASRTKAATERPTRAPRLEDTEQRGAGVSAFTQNTQGPRYEANLFLTSWIRSTWQHLTQSLLRTQFTWT